MNIFLICVISLVAGFIAGMIFHYCLRKKKVIVNEEKQEIANRFNSGVERYNLTVTGFNKMAGEKARLAEKLNDATSLQEIDIILGYFEEDRRLAEKEIAFVNVEVEGKGIWNFNRIDDACEKLWTAVDAMSASISDLEKISPSRPEEQKEGSVLKSRDILRDFRFFYGCGSEDEVKARYRALAKVLHPDTRTGNADIFKLLQNAYEKERNVK